MQPDLDKAIELRLERSGKLQEEVKYLALKAKKILS